VNPLTVLYRDRLAASSSSLLARLLTAWLILYDPARPLWSTARLGELVAPWIGGAQAFAAAETTRWLAALTAQATRSPLARVAPYEIPAGLIGSSAAGGPLAELTGLAPAVWWSRFSGGASREGAAAATASWLGRLAASEPYRAANATTTFNARRDRRLTGKTRRDTRPGACSFCLALAARGFTSARAGFPAHGHCGCTATPEIGTTR
jgi:hypothetical protein